MSAEARRETESKREQAVGADAVSKREQPPDPDPADCSFVRFLTEMGIAGRHGMEPADFEFAWAKDRASLLATDRSSGRIIQIPRTLCYLVFDPKDEK